MGAALPVREPRRSEHEVRGLSTWLRACRQEAGLSQEALADAIGVSRRNYVRWESPSHPTEMGATDLLKFMDAVGIKVSPSPPAEIPRAVNAELADLRHLIETLNLRLPPTMVEEAIELLKRRRSGAPDQPTRQELEQAAESLRRAAADASALADSLQDSARSAQR